MMHPDEARALGEEMALTLDDARDALVDAWREYRLFALEQSLRCPHVGDLPGAIEVLIDAKIAIARQEIAALSPDKEASS